MPIDHSGTLIAPDRQEQRRQRHLAFAALALTIPSATIGEAAGLWFWPGTALGVGIYIFAKVWLVILPLIWLRFIDHQSFSVSPARKGGFGMAIILGCLIAAAISGTYFIARHNHWIDLVSMRRSIAKNHLDILWLYIVFATIVSTANALMEEYVWRWFVFEKAEILVPAGKGTVAAVMAAIFFTIHHLCALKLYFNWPLTLAASAGVFLGGVIWSALYARYRSIWPGFVCHIFADTAIFLVGWDIIFRR